MRIIGQRWLQKGNHTLAIRVSNFHVSSPGLFRSILMGPWSKIQSRVRSRTYPRLIFSGLFFLSAFLSFFFYLRRSRDPSLLFFGLYAVSVFLHAVWILLVETVAVPTPLFSHMEPLEVVTLLMAHVFLLGFVIWHFKIRRPWMLLLALAGFSLGGLLLFRDILRAANASMLIECLSAFLIAVFMTVRRRRGGQLLLMATLSLFSHRLVQLFPGLSGRAEILPPMLWSIILQGTSLFFFLAAIALRIRDENRALHALQLRSRRLEAELLKKTIQPHFIMNTLLSIKSWYLSDPAKGEMLIEALAEEFRIISRVASERTIELCEELDLCRAHLDLMGYRCDVTYTLEVHGACTGIMVPPLLLHTLIENGLTHAFSPRENGNFRFECRTGGTDIVLLLENDGSLLEGIERGRELEEGMGLTYVRTRLEECYPGNWDLAYGISAGRWMVRISIRNKGGA